MLFTKETIFEKNMTCLDQSRLQTKMDQELGLDKVLYSYLYLSSQNEIQMDRAFSRLKVCCVYTFGQLIWLIYTK